MLNVAAVKQAMTAAGLSQAAVADACDVSREAVSNWLKGESQPRPMVLVKLATLLKLEIAQALIEAEVPPEPVVAYRTRRNRAPSDKVLAAARDVGESLRQLVPYIVSDPAFAPPVLAQPTLDEAYIRRCTSRLREDIGCDLKGPISLDQIVDLHHRVGSYLVPVLWGGDKHGHENALHVYLPDSKTSWVILNLNCRYDDFKFWLAHELGHCYSLHALRGTEGETFAERFAATLLFPHDAAAEAYKRIAGSAASKFARACGIADRFDISPITVVREIESFAKTARVPSTNLDSPRLYNHCRLLGATVGTVARDLFDTDTPSARDYISISRAIFGTSFFDALAKFQRDVGKSPALIASVLNVGIADALAISKALDEPEMASSGLAATP
jgi:transcriptional regulator with XRE-family HTH domain